MRTVNLYSVSLLTIAALAAGPGCDSDGLTSKLCSADSIIALTPGADSPVLDALEAELPGSRLVVSELLGLGADELRSSMQCASLISVDLAEADDAQLQEWAPVFEAAERAGVPIAMEHIEDSDEMAQIVGLGVGSDAVLATPDPGGQGWHLAVYGDHGELDSFAPDGADEEEGTEDSERVRRGRAPAEIAAEMADRVIGQEVHVPSRARAQDGLPSGSYYYYYIDRDEVIWEPEDGQEASMETDFEIHLYGVGDDGDGNKQKLMFVTEKASNFHPGDLSWDGKNQRGYYTGSAQFTITPETSDFNLIAHTPTSTDVGMSYNTTTGWEVGLDSDGVVSAGLSGSESESITMSDFLVDNNSTGDDFDVTFELSKDQCDRASYSFWELDYDLRSLPSSAKNTLSPEFEAVYRADAGYAEVAGFELSSVHKLLMNKLTGSEDATCWEYSTWMTDTIDVSVDWSRVNIETNGTIAFSEEFTSWPSDSDEWDTESWEIVNEGIGDYTPHWTTSGCCAIKETGNAYATGSQTGSGKKGTWLHARQTLFGQGSLSTGFYAGDNDGFGLMYGIQDYDNYYRVEIREQNHYIRIHKVEDGVFTTLAADYDYTPPHDTWGPTLAVERSGNTHRIFVNDELLLTATDSTFATGSVALYAYAMNDIRFSNLVIAP